jgi:hypothetical protein
MRQSRMDDPYLDLERIALAVDRGEAALGAQARADMLSYLGPYWRDQGQLPATICFQFLKRRAQEKGFRRNERTHY